MMGEGEGDIVCVWRVGDNLEYDGLDRNGVCWCFAVDDEAWAEIYTLKKKKVKVPQTIELKVCCDEKRQTDDCNLQWEIKKGLEAVIYQGNELVPDLYSDTYFLLTCLRTLLA